MASSQTYSLISQFSTCELSDALVKLGFPTEFLIPDIRRMSHYEGSESERICGPAYTVKMVLATDEEAPKLTEHFVDTVIDGSVVVVDAPPQVKNAVWGGLMTAGAQYRGAKAVVINGRVRDLGEHKDARFAVFARGNSTMGQTPFTRPSAVQVPLTIKAEPVDCGFPDTTVNPGDIIVADEDGVVCVPAEIDIDTLIRVAQIGREADEKCMHDIKAGLGVQASFKKYRSK